MTGRPFVWALLCAGAALAACDATVERVPARGRVRVAAAADLNAALGELIARFGASHDVDVSVSYGSSGTFYAQLLNHAPFDLFFSADLEYPKQLASRGLTMPGTEFTYAVGRLVLWAPLSSSLDPEQQGLRALLAPSVAHVAIANPEHAPYGENVAQAMQFVQSGAADAGIVALSLALAPSVKGQGRRFEIPLSMYPRMEQGGTILRWAVDPAAARLLREFVLGADGRAILERYGFFLPET